jgi:hypothetical protein
MNPCHLGSEIGIGITMNYKKLEFTNDAGQRLAARIDLPKNPQPVAYALFAHCFTCSKNIKAILPGSAKVRAILVIRIFLPMSRTW